MPRVLSTLVLAGTIAAGPASGAPPGGPSFAACLRSWNAPENGAARQAVVRLGPWKALRLSVAMLGPDNVLGSRVRPRSSPGCVLTLLSRGEMAKASAPWSSHSFGRWRVVSFGLGSRSPTLTVNARLAADGRLAVR